MAITNPCLGLTSPSRRCQADGDPLGRHRFANYSESEPNRSSLVREAQAAFRIDAATRQVSEKMAAPASDREVPPACVPYGIPAHARYRARC
jgi:hypothetical protein